MSEELGRIEKPEAKERRGGRKLYLVPLIFGPRETEDEFSELVTRYWEQVQDHLTNLEVGLGKAGKVYHELIPVGGEKGLTAIEELNPGSHLATKTRLDQGAGLESLEEGELLAEFMDWTRCLTSGLQSQNAFSKVYESYAEVQKKRAEHMTKRIDETLGSDESGTLFMREGHQIQFPSDVEVFYIAPPALEDIKRWLRAQETQAPVSWPGTKEDGSKP